LDLCYEEDSSADVDLNVVMTASGKFVEIQGTAEREPFSKAQLDQLLNLAKKGIDQVLIAQKKSLRR
jgi:ribonuclease PH